MMKRSILTLVVMSAGAAAGAAGCAVQPGAPDEAVVPRLTANTLTASAVFNGALTTDVLDATSAAAMADTEDAREVLRYAVGCALDASQSVSFTVDGTPYTATGALGLATGWTTSGLTAGEAAWVSACVFSRANLTGASIAISDRGTASALATTETERATYQIEEGAFWGNAFIDLGAIAPVACNGVDQAADDSEGDLPYRQCAQPDGVPGSHESPCGMVYAGLCSDVCTSNSPYAGCAASGATPAAAVVTSFLYGTR